METLRKYDKKHYFLYVIVKCFKTLTFRDIF